MIKLKVPRELKDKEFGYETYGFILVYKDGYEIKYVGSVSFSYGPMMLEIYTSESRAYVHRIKDIARLEYVIFKDENNEMIKEEEIEVFAFE